MKRQRKDGREFVNDMDIAQALRGWAFEPGQVNVRLIRGNDGKPKLQLRLDLGLLQMELDGRPDGRRPHRATSELDFQKRKLEKHAQKYGSDAGFKLAARDCQALREESAMFYHRYLSLFVLEQFDSVIRDTQHNLDVLDICRKYGGSDYDRMCLEQYRAYIMMMNSRAKACEALRQGYVQTAIAYLRGGIKRIAHLLPKEQRRKTLRKSHEAHILLEMLSQIRSQLPPDKKTVLQKQLREAVSAERFEEAAKVRDELAAMMREMAHPKSNASREEAATPGSGSMPEMPKGAKAKKARKPRQKKTGDEKEG